MARHPDDNINASRAARSLNTRREEGDPPRELASPMTTGFSPLQGGTLDEVLGLSNPGDPTDSLGRFTTHKRSKR